MNYVYKTLAVSLCLFVLIGVNTTWLEQQPKLALFGVLGMVLVFLTKPAAERWADTWASRIVDYVLVAAAVLVFGYMFVQNEMLLQVFWLDEKSLGDRAGIETATEFVLGGIGLVLVLEATRRAIGWTLPILCLVFIVYSYYGQQMPDWAMPHAGFKLREIAQSSFLQGGVFGIALRIMFQYVFLFVLFGTLLEQTGATGYVINFARSMFRSSTGGPAKVAVVSSGLMGSLSGSAVANTATTGTFTIPLMKSCGFSANAAGGIEAAASSGGALMPPIMGAGAYMMLELVPGSPTYVEIIQAALLPAILYYGALLLTVHFHAKRIGAGGEATLSHAGSEDPMKPAAAADSEGASSSHDSSHRASDKPVVDESFTFYQGVVFFGSFVVLIGALLSGVTPFLAVSIGMAGVFVLSCFSRRTILTPEKLVEACTGAAKGGVALIVAASCVGIILALVSMTGLGNALPAKILTLSGGSILIALLLLMVSTIILGMGLPSAVCYLLMATMVKVALEGLNTPPLAAHLFIFYFGMMSMVTPPVALAAYAAAAISKGDVIWTAFQAFRFSLVGFALPFFFVLNPEILMLTAGDELGQWQPASWLAIVTAFGIVSIAIYGLAAGIAGQAAGKLSYVWRGILLSLSLVVFFTRSVEEFWIQTPVVGVLLVLLVVEATTTMISKKQVANS